MATDILTATVTSTAPARTPPPPLNHFPRGLAISDLDLDLRDDRYPIISSSRHVPSTLQRPSPSVDIIPSHTPFYPDAVHQAVRGSSLPSSDLSSYDLNMAALRFTSAQPDIPQVTDESRLRQLPDTQSPLLGSASPQNSYPLEHVQPINNGSPSMNEINLQLFGPSQASQASSGDISKVPPTADLPSHPTNHAFDNLPRPG
ncbi:hypothetical protein B0F90DRAFT_1815285 [Multifurca ochricompacta]|uniref:Uncharacterized protein n=1 Tax=Multifurca ochricompacta TaxID=376703 RepID=A0AAD4M8E3_9AGAM|nr:hypothetical protein B0F90DRAFT_1815285 [Multifurca ochricompacta]